MPPRRRLGAYDDDDVALGRAAVHAENEMVDDGAVRPFWRPTRRAEERGRRRERIEQHEATREAVQARRQLEEAERDLRENPERATAEREQRHLLHTAQLVTQADIASVHVPLDYAEPVAPPDGAALFVLLHTDRRTSTPPTLLRARWMPDGASEPHPLVDVQELLRVVPSDGASDACWTAKLPLPAAFSRLEAWLVQAAPHGEARGDGDAPDQVGVEDDAEAIEAVERLQAGEASAPWGSFEAADCLLSRGVVLHQVPHEGLVGLRVADRAVVVPASDPERSRRVVHLQGFLGASLPPYEGVRLVDRQHDVSVQNLPAALVVTRGTLTLDVRMPALLPADEPEIQTVELVGLSPADLLSGTLIIDWPLVAPSPSFPALIGAHWRRVYVDLIGALVALEPHPAERLRVHAHLLAFAAKQAAVPATAAQGDHAVALRSLLFATKGDGREGVFLRSTLAFINEALVAAAASSSPAPSAHAAHCDTTLWLLGLAGQIAHALRHPVQANGERIDPNQPQSSMPHVQLQPPDDLWELLTPDLWSGDKLALLSARVDELRARYGWRAVRAGLTALLGPDAQWLLGHPLVDGLARGVSSYRFCRLLPLRATLIGEGSGAARQYALQVAADTQPRWQREVGILRAKIFHAASDRVTFFDEWESAQAAADALGRAHAAKQRLEQADLLLGLSRAVSAVVTPGTTHDWAAKGELQEILSATASALRDVSTELLTSAKAVPALAADYNDEARSATLWETLRSARNHLQQVLLTVGNAGVRRQALARLAVDRPGGTTALEEEDGGEGATAACEVVEPHVAEPPGGDLMDPLQADGAALARIADDAFASLKALHSDLRTLAQDYGRFTAAPPSVDSTSFVCYPMMRARDAEKEKEKETATGGGSIRATAAIFPLDDRCVLLLDRASSALLAVDAGKTEVMTLVGGRSAGHADGQLNLSKLSAPGPRKRGPALTPLSHDPLVCSPISAPPRTHRQVACVSTVTRSWSSPTPQTLYFAALSWGRRLVT